MERETGNVVFIDDDKTFVGFISRAVARRTSEWNCHTALSEAEALRLVERVQPEVIVLDLALNSGRGPEDGLALMPKLFAVVDCARILVLTGHGDDSSGIRCINAGAASFLVKPPDTDHLVALIEDGMRVARLARSSKENSIGALSGVAAAGLITRSDNMKHVIEHICFAASTPQPVLICGETGVGKGVIAHAIHRASERNAKPFIRMQPNFGSHDLITSELFGHTRGAFTGASDNRVGLIQDADGGSLFIDEVDSLPQQTQIALLNVLQEKEFHRIGSGKTYRSDFRLISATNMPFDALTDGGPLRPDFYHRIAHTVIHIPPLRERRADIPDLAREFVSRLTADDEHSPVCGIANDAFTWLSSQPWPGNVRELQATVERGYSHAKYHERRFIQLSDLKAPLPPKEIPLDRTLAEQLRTYELTIVSSVFIKNHQNYSATAKALGIDRKRLRRILSRAECAL